MHNIKLKKIKIPPMEGTMPMPEMSGPMFYVDDVMMPEIANWEVGKKYKMIVEVEQKSKNEDEHGVHGGFEIVAYKHLKEKSINDMDDREFGEYQSKEMAKH